MSRPLMPLRGRLLIVPLIVGVVTGVGGFAVAHVTAKPSHGHPTLEPTATSSSTSTSSSRSSSTASSTARASSPPVDPVSAKARAAYARLTPQQRVGQLFMIGVTSTGPTSTQTQRLAAAYGGNVFLRFHSSLGVAQTATITAALREITTFGGVQPFISADQEGGQAQALTGTGFDTIPTGVTQGRTVPKLLRADAARWAAQLKAAGVSLDLAPVGDVVPTSVGTTNQPIGRYYRQYGADPALVGTHTAAFVRGMSDGGVATSLKHFPGLGRATGNTDNDPTATDPTTRDDPFLAAYRPAVAAGVPFLMIASANYPTIDPDNRACFSPMVIAQMVRKSLGFTGVVISDSFGSASLASTPAGTRAVRFLRAGGTMVLDTNWLDLAPMTRAVLDEAGGDKAFAATVRSAVLLVLEAKVRAGLVSTA